MLCYVIRREESIMNIKGSIELFITVFHGYCRVAIGCPMSHRGKLQLMFSQLLIWWNYWDLTYDKGIYLVKTESSYRELSDIDCLRSLNAECGCFTQGGDSSRLDLSGSCLPLEPVISAKILEQCQELCKNSRTSIPKASYFPEQVKFIPSDLMHTFVLGFSRDFTRIGMNFESIFSGTGSKKFS